MFNFNGISAKNIPWLRIKDIQGSVLPPLRRRYVTVPGKEGAYHAGRDVGIRREVITIKVNGDSLEGLMEKRRFLAEWLDTEETAPFFYDHEPTKVYRAVLSEETNLDQVIYYGEVDLIFEMPDPYAESIEKKTARLQGATVHYLFTDFSAEGTLFDLVADENGMRLAREGTDVTGASSWDAGMHYRTVVDSGKLRLEKTGDDISYTWSTGTDWARGTLSGRLTISGNTLRLNTESWDIADDMDDFRAQGWQTSGDNIFSQQFNHVLINGANPVTTQTRLYKTHGTAFTQATFDFKASITGDDMKAWISNGTNGWRVFLPNTNGEVHWFRIRIIGTSTAELYVDGALTATTIEYATSSSQNIQFYLQSAGDASVMRVYRVYFAPSDKGAPPENGLYTGQWESEVVSLSAARTVGTSLLDASASYSGEDIDDANLYIEAKLIIDGIEQDWVSFDYDLAIPGLNPGDNVENVEVQFRITLQTLDPGAITYISRMDVSVISGYYPDGYFESNPIDISQVGKAAATSITWEPQQGVKILTRVSLDAGNTWSEWAETEPGSIPGITQSTDLTNAQFQYRVVLETDNAAASPTFNNLNYTLTAAYKPTGQWLSPPISLEDANIVGDSAIFFTWNGIQDIQLEARVNGGAWQPVENGGEIPGVRGTEGAVVEVRLTLSTADTLETPNIDSLEVTAKEAIDSFIEYDGTAPGYPVFYIDVIDELDSLQILHVESGRFVLLEGNFQPGDAIVIDHNDQSITLNGVYRLDLLNIKSRLFRLQKGINSFDVEPKYGTTISMEWVERWK